MAMMVKKVKALRKEKKYSQEELAARSGVSLGSIKRFERTGEISFGSLLKIAQILGRLSDFEEVMKVDERMNRVRKKFDKG